MSEFFTVGGGRRRYTLAEAKARAAEVQARTGAIVAIEAAPAPRERAKLADLRARDAKGAGNG